MHCNPAPPHPPPGEVFNAFCPPLGGWPESMLAFGLLFAATLSILYLFGRYNGEVAADD